MNKGIDLSNKNIENITFKQIKNLNGVIRSKEIYNELKIDVVY